LKFCHVCLLGQSAAKDASRQQRERIMRWTIARALLIGFVLAMALAFGGRIISGPVVPSPPLQNSK
jgi:hypothetical protein